MKKLALLHTVVFLADFFKKKLAEKYPDLSSFHVMDESLLQDLMSAGEVTPAVIRRLAGQAFLAREAGAEVILFTCSSTSPAVDFVRPMLDIPVIKIDDPLAERAVQTGRRIGLVCTAKTTVGPSERLVMQHAAAQKKEVKTTVCFEPSAFDAVMAGDRKRHDEIIAKAVTELSQNCDVVVLAQASMAHLVPALSEKIPCPSWPPRTYASSTFRPFWRIKKGLKQ